MTASPKSTTTAAIVPVAIVALFANPGLITTSPLASVSVPPVMVSTSTTALQSSIYEKLLKV